MNVGSASIVPGGSCGKTFAYVGRRSRYSTTSGRVSPLVAKSSTTASRVDPDRAEDQRHGDPSAILARCAMDHRRHRSVGQGVEHRADRQDRHLHELTKHERHIGAAVGGEWTRGAERGRRLHERQVQVLDRRCGEWSVQVCVFDGAQVDHRPEADHADEMVDVVGCQLLEAVAAEQPTVPGPPASLDRESAEVAEVHRASEPGRLLPHLRVVTPRRGGRARPTPSRGEPCPANAAARRPGSGRPIGPSPRLLRSNASRSSF